MTVVQKGETPTATSPTERRDPLAVLELVVLVLVGAVFDLSLV